MRVMEHFAAFAVRHHALTQRVGGFDQGLGDGAVIAGDGFLAFGLERRRQQGGGQDGARDVAVFLDVVTVDIDDHAGVDAALVVALYGNGALAQAYRAGGLAGLGWQVWHVRAPSLVCPVDSLALPLAGQRLAAV